MMRIARALPDCLKPQGLESPCADDEGVSVTGGAQSGTQLGNETDEAATGLGHETTPFAQRLRLKLHSVLNRRPEQNVDHTHTATTDFDPSAFSARFLFTALVRHGIADALDENFPEEVRQKLGERGFAEGTHFEVQKEGDLHFLQVKDREVLKKMRAVCDPVPNNRNELSSAPALLQARDRLLSAARSYFDRDTTIRPRVIPAFDPAASAGTVIRSLLGSSEGLVIGESHEESSGKRVIMDNLKTMKKAGVRTLFLEHLFYDQDQALLDRYLAAPAHAPMPKNLEARLAAINPLCRDAKYNFVGVVKAAKKAGLKMVAIDCTASYWLHKGGLNATEDSERNRMLAMNYLADHFIRNRKDEGKWIAFVGSAHCNTYRGVPGLADLSGVPSVVAEDVAAKEWQHNNTQETFVQTQVKGFGASADFPQHPGINPDVVISYKF